MEDITKTGPVGLKGLKGLNQQGPSTSSQYFQNLRNMSVGDLNNAFIPKATENVGLTLAESGYGDSMFDDSISRMSQVEDLQEVRAQEQPWYAQIGAGLAKGAVLAGTTFIDGTVGLLFGTGQGIANWFDDDPNTGFWSGLWDNDFSKALQQINDVAEEALPNYYSQDELNSPWYENIFTANFLGDKFIKNLGFAVGALYSGGVASTALKATKLPQLIGAITNSTKAPAMVSTAVGAVTSAVNEGRIEALNNSRDWMNLKIQELDDAWMQNIIANHESEKQSIMAGYEEARKEYEAKKGTLKKINTPEGIAFVDPAEIEYEQKIKALDARRANYEAMIQSAFDNRKNDEIYNNTLGKITEDRIHMGNADLLMNIPILMASNMVQFAKFYANGFNTARRAGVNATRKTGQEVLEYTGKTFSKGKAAAKVIGNSLTEGTEEISQKAASLVAGDYYSTDVNNFYKAQMDPNAEKESLDWMKSFANGINETVNDGSSWEEFFIGSLTGLLGVPSFRSIKDANGKIQSPVKLEGGAYHAIKDYSEEVARSQEIANYLNARVQSPEFLNYYKGMIRHNKYQNDMNRAVEENDEFSFKNAEHAQLVSDIVMFDNAGRLSDLETYINMAFDTSDENIQSIIDNTTSESSHVFTDRQGNPMPKEQIIEKLTQNKDEILNAVKQYRKTKEDLDTRTGGVLSNDQLTELTWLELQIKNWTDRATDMTGVIKTSLTDLLSTVQGLASIETDSSMAEGFYQVANELQKALGTNDKALVSMLTAPQNIEFVEGLIENISNFSGDQIGVLSKQRVIDLLSDLPKIGRGVQTYTQKLDEYTRNPEKIAEAQAEAEEEVKQEVQETQSNELKSKLSAATNTHEFREIFLNDESENKEDTLNSLIADGNTFARDYKEIEDYDAELKKALIAQGEDTETLKDASTLWENQYALAENMQQIAYPESAPINDETTFIEDSNFDDEVAGVRFEKARYALQKAISKVNNDIKFAKSFSPAYKKPAVEPINPKATTGASGTASIPPVNSTSSTSNTGASAAPANSTVIARQTRTSKSGRVRTSEVFEESRTEDGDVTTVNLKEVIVTDSEKPELAGRVITSGGLDIPLDSSTIDWNRQASGGTRPDGSKVLPEEVSQEEIDEAKDTMSTLLENGSGIIGPFKASTIKYAKDGTIIAEDKKGNFLYLKEDPIVTTNVPVGNISAEEVKTENKKLNDDSEDPESYDKKNPGQKQYYRPVIPQLHIAASKEGDFRPFDVVVAEKESGVDFSKIYEYIRKNGAFTYVNEGKLKAGDTLKFMIDPEFEEQVANEPWHTAPTIFITTEDGQIVGSLDEGASMNNFVGLPQVIAKVREEYKQRQESSSQEKVTTDNTDPFYSTLTTKVSKIMVGKIPYSDEERSLKDIPGQGGLDLEPIFGIIKNGVLVTNRKDIDNFTIKPMDMSNKEGRLYLLIPNAAGTYSPAAVRVKHFNQQEFNLEDATVSSTRIGGDINSALDSLVEATNKDDVARAMKSLSRDLYLQDVMSTWFDNAAGSGIVISKKVKQPNGSYEMVTINGQEMIKEDKVSIYFQGHKESAIISGMKYSYMSAKTMGMDLSPFTVDKSSEEIKKEIINVLYGFNLPIQVSVSDINKSAYNKRLMDSNILTSNLERAEVIGNWFTTDYIDADGNIQKAVNPKSKSYSTAPSSSSTSPVGGTEGVATGTKVTVDGFNFTVDLKKKILWDHEGKKHSFTRYNMAIVDMAWAQEVYGDATEGSQMTDNKVITPSNQVLDRNTGKYLYGEEAQKVRDIISGKSSTSNQVSEEAKAKKDKAKAIVAEIYKNQAKIDKTKTDNKYYYILEEDGEYHPYARVHTVLGDNWLEESKETKASKFALKAGSAVDQVIRDFFSNKPLTRPEILSKEAFDSLISKLNSIAAKMQTNGETFKTDNLVLFHKYPDGTRIAGEVDILSETEEGDFNIYDAKTSKYSFSHENFTKKSNKQRMSTKDYYTLQLSAYYNLFEAQYGVAPKALGILPSVLTYDSKESPSIVLKLTPEKGIPITYNPNVPIQKGTYSAPTTAIESSTTTNSLPIFNTIAETMNPEDRVSNLNAFDNDEGVSIGYYEQDGDLYKGYLKKIGEVEVTYESGAKEKVPIHITKVRNRGFSKDQILDSSAYLAVFPNGLAVSVIQFGENDQEAFDVIMQGLSNMPDNVKAAVLETTKLSAGNPTAPSSNNTTGGAVNSAKAENAVNKRSAKRVRHKLRAIDNTRPLWNKREELAWLKEVLPQLSAEDRVRVVEGLIQVHENGPVAWGMFSDGIVTLSDLAAKGTTYHEAFHVVFNLMTDPEQRKALFKEAREIFGEKSEDELEEDMAEAFREYVMTKEERSLGQKIIDFFKNLFAKVTNWKYVKPSLYSYYRMIDQGAYKKASLGSTSKTAFREEAYTKEMEDIKARAIADGSFMKAPNGKPTNLNERQWLQVRTKNFINWFGDWLNDKERSSKVVDENGEPLVVYHYTDNENLTIFSTNFDNYFSKAGGTKKAIFFTEDNVEVGSENNFLTNRKKKLSLFLNIRNLEEHIGTKEDLHKQGTSYREVVNKSAEKDDNTRGLVFRGFDDNRKENQTIYVVHSSNQIKSATSNTGEFSSANNDIRYREVDTMHPISDSVLRRETQRFLDNFNITIKDVKNYDSDIPLFDALNRVINIRNEEDITEGVGYAVAFMMQHSPLVKNMVALHDRAASPVRAKGLRRGIKKEGEVPLTSIENVSQQDLKEVGKDIADALRELYGMKKPSEKVNAYLKKAFEVIKEFFNLLTPKFIGTLNIISHNTRYIANAIKLNDPSIITDHRFKPGTDTIPEVVNLERALIENPYEESIISALNKYNIALAGSASIALQGVLLRPKENPLHDIDFQAASHTRESLDKIMQTEYPNHLHIRTIQNGLTEITESYLIMDRPFKKGKPIGEGIGYELLDSSTGEVIGSYENFELHLKKGVKGKILDFFTGKGSGKYGKYIEVLNGKPYQISDFRNAMTAKISWSRLKDIWDYNRFIPHSTNKTLAEQKEARKAILKRKLQNAQIIWGHPAIGKTTYLERNDDILEWDELVNPKRDEFFKQQIDPNNKMSEEEYKVARSKYMEEWREHPEYVEFLTREWNNLVARARREGKRLFASPLPLLEIGRKDFDLVVALNHRDFMERNQSREGTFIGSLGWKQNIAEALLRIDPSKVEFTEDYFSDFMRNNLGVTWGTLTQQEEDKLAENGWTKEKFNSISQAERDNVIDCLAL